MLLKGQSIKKLFSDPECEDVSAKSAKLEVGSDFTFGSESQFIEVEDTGDIDDENVLL